MAKQPARQGWTLLVLPEPATRKMASPYSPIMLDGIGDCPQASHSHWRLVSALLEEENTAAPSGEMT